MNTANLKIKKVLKENSTHYACKSVDGKHIQIWRKGCNVAEWKDENHFMHEFTKNSIERIIPAENEDDLFAIFEAYEEEIRILTQEAKEEFNGYPD